MSTPRQYLAAVHALERKYSPVIERIITKFRKQFIASYKANPSGAHSALQQQVMNEDIIKVLRSMYVTGGKLGGNILISEIRKKLTPRDLAQIRNAARKSGAVYFLTKAGGLGRNEEWIARVNEYLRVHGLEMATKITETMREDIIAILQMAVDQGWGIDQTVRELQTRRVVARAEVIARTELNTATNEGHRAAAKSLPFMVIRKWIAAKDERTRPGHRDVNGHKVGEDDYFSVPIYEGKKKIGTEDMIGPGDPKASIGNRANCRCREIAEPLRDANGALVLRNPNQAQVIPMRRVPRIPVADIAAVLKSQIKIGVEE